MTPNEPGWYWATDTSSKKRAIVQVWNWQGIGLRAYICGRDEDMELDWFTDWSERLVDPRDEFGNMSIELQMLKRPPNPLDFKDGVPMVIAEHPAQMRKRDP